MAILFAQAKDTFTGGSATSAAATFDNPTVNGNLVVAMFMRGGAAAATGCADNVVGTPNTYVNAVPLLAGHISAEIWYCPNIVGRTGHIVTFSWTNAITNNEVIIYEFSGVATSSPSDANAVGIAGLGGTSTNPTLQSLTTANANDVVVALCNAAANTAGPAGWTWNANFNAGYKIVSSTGAVGGGNFTDSNNSNWTSSIYAFTAAAASAVNPGLTSLSSGSISLSSAPKRAIRPVVSGF